jgi:hypothetical protein
LSHVQPALTTLPSTLDDFDSARPNADPVDDDSIGPAPQLRADDLDFDDAANSIASATEAARDRADVSDVNDFTLDFLGADLRLRFVFAPPADDLSSPDASESSSSSSSLSPPASTDSPRSLVRRRFACCEAPAERQQTSQFGHR